MNRTLPDFDDFCESVWADRFWDTLEDLLELRDFIKKQYPECRRMVRVPHDGPKDIVVPVMESDRPVFYWSNGDGETELPPPFCYYKPHHVRLRPVLLKEGREASLGYFEPIKTAFFSMDHERQPERRREFMERLMMEAMMRP